MYQPLDVSVEDIVVVDQKTTKRVLRVRCKMKTFSFVNGRWFSYLTDLEDLKQYIPEITPSDYLLLIVVLDTYSASKIDTPECTEFIGNFNEASFTKFPFIHELTDVTPSGVGFSVLQGQEYKPRTGTKPQKSLINKTVHHLNNHQSEYRITMDHLWIRTISGKNYVLKDIKFFTRLE